MGGSRREARLVADTYQTLTLVLADGRRVTYMGRPQLTAGEAVRVVEILAGEPTPLPPGCTWDTPSAAPKEIE